MSMQCEPQADSNGTAGHSTDTPDPFRDACFTTRQRHDAVDVQQTGVTREPLLQGHTLQQRTLPSLHNINPHPIPWGNTQPLLKQSTF
jgi:hypothetical protein